MSYLFPTYARLDIEVEKAEGAYLYDTNGKKYLDFVSGIAVCNLGHCPKTVSQSIQKQLEKVWHVSNLFQIPLQEKVAKKLVEHSVGDAVFFANSGAEANEAAIKLARKHTGKHKIITFLQSFHGRTYATLSATGQKKVQEGFGPLAPTFEYLPYNDVEAVKSLKGNDIAAIMVEVVQGEGGVVPGDPTFLKAIEEKCKELDALFIVDEVQTGIGRTGKAFAYEHYKISPDIITLAKGLGSGFPVGAMIGKKHLISSFSPGSHASTFGGNPLAMAAADATLDEIFNESFLTSVSEKGKWLKQQLIEQLQDEPLVKDIRGKGLMIGIELNTDVQNVLTSLRENGLLALPAGPKVIRLLPPLTVTKQEMEKAIHLLASNIHLHSLTFSPS
ncbi:acetylornithine transaminase [Bacillus alveayuensis]|jgi:acetylornithine aminotransferase|uniref:acetylornithine transaminase n=1 Tax=Aeribacillus alveayuensis TaxID=279215 RepID=UPI0005D11256|nr:acetylornithine transaminase [Bacillus alveayuensis]